ncbi:MAG TPA: hypothetical protein VM141_12385 [Planctomycetota bacterium]|nr:hypothetical protein [Planctomycetota bacterium]
MPQGTPTWPRADGSRVAMKNMRVFHLENARRKLERIPHPTSYQRKRLDLIDKELRKRLLGRRPLTAAEAAHIAPARGSQALAEAQE